MTKYHAKATTIDGYRFDSKAESNRYLELNILAKFEQITDLTVHPRFVIWQRYSGSKKRAEVIEYEGDFSYTENGQRVVEDVKGVLTEVYRLKKKMFLARYPEIKFVEIKA